LKGLRFFSKGKYSEKEIVLLMVDGKLGLNSLLEYGECTARFQLFNQEINSLFLGNDSDVKRGFLVFFVLV